MTDAELVLQFESLGDNCELGLVQRHAGVEPLGLFRFAGAPLRHLLRAMEARFEGMADPAHVRVQPENGEYMIKLTKYDFIYHAHVKIGAADPAELHRQQVRTVGFLVRKLIDDLENPTKILVFRQNEPLLASDLTDLRIALSGYGPSTLLWVQEARPGHPAGDVVAVDDRLLIGYVSRLARRDNVPDLDVRSWLAMLRNAYARHSGQAAVAKDMNLVFGVSGNAAAHTGPGWSAPEDGFTWAIDDSSVLTLPSLIEAESFLLEMEVVPFVVPEALPAQALTIEIAGQQAHVFDPLPRGTATCVLPGRLFRGNAPIELVLRHPRAASPSAVANQDDRRRLAVAFYKLSLRPRQDLG